MKLIRKPSNSLGTFGEWLDDQNNHLCFTCELPWKDNHPLTSCIPLGEYEVIPFHSPSKGDVFLIQSVPNRSMIEIHSANYPAQLLGCVAVGAAYMKEGGEIIGVANSKTTLNMLLDAYPQGFTLRIENAS